MEADSALIPTSWYSSACQPCSKAHSRCLVQKHAATARVGRIYCSSARTRTSASCSTPYQFRSAIPRTYASSRSSTRIRPISPVSCRLSAILRSDSSPTSILCKCFIHPWSALPAASIYSRSSATSSIPVSAFTCSFTACSFTTALRIYIARTCTL